MSDSKRDRTAIARVSAAVVAMLLLVGVTAGAAERATTIQLAGRDPAGHGIVLRTQQGKTILLVSGTPEQMGAAHGTLLKAPARKCAEKALYLVGGAESVHAGVWFLDRMEEIERRALPHIPQRFLAECDALSKAVGISQRDGRYANLFPERFHCSGVAVRGKATKDGSVVHARVLDYMRDINLQRAACVQVFMPEGKHAWMSLGYAGLIGTVTAMNEKGLSIGEMGGHGQGDWDGVPMTLLLRDVMERAATVDEALEILSKSPRTCEYYYVLSDRSRAMAGVHADARQITILRPGEQHSSLPHVPEDAVMFSAGERAKTLSRRIEDAYGRIDVAAMIEIIKRPVAMNSNLHDAIFAPETLDMYFADAGRRTPACDEPYTHCNLGQLIRLYKQVMDRENRLR